MLDLGRIGGSDAPACMAYYYPEIREQLLAEHPADRISAYALWARIVHGVQSTLGSLAEHARWGKRLERPIFSGWLEDTRRATGDPANDERWWWTGDDSFLHPTREWQRISPDAVRHTSYNHVPRVFLGSVEIADIKFPHWRVAAGMAEGTVPVAYEIQLQAYMEATRAERAFLVPLIGGELHELPVPRSVALGEAIVEACERFWFEHVLTEVPPRLDGSERTQRAIDARWGRIGPARPPRDATAEEARLIEHLVICAEYAKDANGDHDQAKNAVREIIGDTSAVKTFVDGAPVKVSNGLQAGRDSIDWAKVLDEVARQTTHSLAWVEAIVAEHTTPGEPYRVLRTHVGKAKAKV